MSNLVVTLHRFIEDGETVPKPVRALALSTPAGPVSVSPDGLCATPSGNAVFVSSSYRTA